MFLIPATVRVRDIGEGFPLRNFTRLVHFEWCYELLSVASVRKAVNPRIRSACDSPSSYTLNRQFPWFSGKVCEVLTDRFD